MTSHMAVYFGKGSMIYLLPNWHGGDEAPLRMVLGKGLGLRTLSTQFITGLGCLDSGFLNSFSSFQESFWVSVFLKYKAW